MTFVGSTAVTMNNTVFCDVVEITGIHKKVMPPCSWQKGNESVREWGKKYTHTLKMEAARSSETSVNLYQNTLRPVPKYGILQGSAKRMWTGIISPKIVVAC